MGKSRQSAPVSQSSLVRTATVDAISSHTAPASGETTTPADVASKHENSFEAALAREREVATPCPDENTRHRGPVGLRYRSAKAIEKQLVEVIEKLAWNKEESRNKNAFQESEILRMELETQRQDLEKDFQDAIEQLRNEAYRHYHRLPKGYRNMLKAKGLAKKFENPKSFDVKTECKIVGDLERGKTSTPQKNPPKTELTVAAKLRRALPELDEGIPWDVMLGCAGLAMVPNGKRADLHSYWHTGDDGPHNRFLAEIVGWIEWFDTPDVKKTSPSGVEKGAQEKKGGRPRNKPCQAWAKIASEDPPKGRQKQLVFKIRAALFGDAEFDKNGKNKKQLVAAYNGLLHNFPELCAPGKEKRLVESDISTLFHRTFSPPRPWTYSEAKPNNFKEKYIEWINEWSKQKFPMSDGEQPSRN